MDKTLIISCDNSIGNDVTAYVIRPASGPEGRRADGTNVRTPGLSAELKAECRHTSAFPCLML